MRFWLVIGWRRGSGWASRFAMWVVGAPRPAYRLPPWVFGVSGRSVFKSSTPGRMLSLVASVCGCCSLFAVLLSLSDSGSAVFDP
eukprot:scaffold75423_cov39-Tisochrysis_lutea.AAC.1